jgi:hypothetical protein
MAAELRVFESLDLLESRDHGRQHWQRQYQAAIDAMPKPRPDGLCKILIEVAAQHPLRGSEPNGERRPARTGDWTSPVVEGHEVEIYVPGSRHQHNGVADPISLSAAGVGYLTSRGIPRGCLHGDDLNERFAASTGVYCSMDECRVTAEYFRAGQFDRLIAILGPYQVFRKAFHYFENLVSPEIHAVSDPVREFFAFAALAAIKNDGDGHTYDDLVATWRRERKPDACH